MQKLNLTGQTVFTAPTGFTGPVTQAPHNPINGHSADRSTKTISNIVRCVGYLFQLVHARGAFKPDPENIWEVVANNIIRQGTSSFIDFALAQRVDVLKTIRYVSSGGCFNSKIANKASNQEVDELLKCARFVISALNNTILRELDPSFQSQFGISLSRRCGFATEFIAIARQTNAVFHALKDVYVLGMRKDKVLLAFRQIVMLAVTVNISVLLKPQFLGPISGALINILQLESSLCSIKNLYMDYRDYSRLSEN